MLKADSFVLPARVQLLKSYEKRDKYLKTFIAFCEQTYSLECPINPYPILH